MVMTWAAIVKFAMQALAAFAKFLGDRQLLTAGQAQALAEGQKDAIERFDRASNAAAQMDAGKPSDPDWVQRVRDRGRTGGGPKP
jgi:hypothetical protein